MGVLVNEIGALYPAFLAGQPSPLPELPIQYPDFAIWQRRRLAGAFLEAELDWWRSRLAGMSPVLELPETISPWRRRSPAAPEPLLPAAFVPLSALPLTPSGKVDRRALPDSVEAQPEGATYVEPQSALERTIAEIYRDLLRVGRVGLHDNFFDLGGHSLLIVRAHQKLREALGKEIPVLDLFRFPTVAALARHLGRRDGDRHRCQRKIRSC